MTKKLFVIAAGSGGHILPALTLAKQWKYNNQRGEITLFTGNKKLEQTITGNHPEIDKILPCHLPQFSLSNWWRLPFLVVKIILIFFRSLLLMTSYKPEKIISTGGILSIPICLAAWLTRRPIELYELNVVPGKANKLLFPLAFKIYITFDQAKKYCSWKWFNFSNKCEITRYPLRFTSSDKNIDKQTTLDSINEKLKKNNNPLQFDTSRKTLFILGGSQGSAFLNKLITNFITKHPNICSQIQIIHQTGKANQELDAWYMQKNIPALTFSYDKSIHHYYIVADLVVSRAGAGTLFELAFFNKKSVIIPLVANTTNHQVYNALAMQEKHPDLFTVIKQQEVTKNSSLCFKTISEIL